MRSALFAALFAAVAAGYSHGSPVRAARFEAGGGLWSSSGRDEFVIGGITMEGIGFESLLDWEKLDAPMLFLEAKWHWTEMLGIRAAWGGGRISGGKNTDSDYIFFAERPSERLMFLQSTSETGGDARFAELDIVLSWYPPGKAMRLDAIAGFAFYEDKLRDRNMVETFRGVGGEPQQVPGPNAEFDFRWSAARSGFAGVFLLPVGAVINLEALLMYEARYRGEGFWILREEFSSNKPNLLHEADGWGAKAAAEIAYPVTDNLSLGLGWRMILFRAEDGAHTVRLADGREGLVPLKSVESIRSGLAARAALRF